MKTDNYLEQNPAQSYPLDSVVEMMVNPRLPALDVRPLTQRLSRNPMFLGVAVQDAEGRPFVIDDAGRFWMLDGSGEVA